MPLSDLLSKIVYLDRDYVSGAYEAYLGESPTTQVTKSEGMKAGAQIPFFSAGVSATESRSFSISTLGMLDRLMPELSKFPTLNKTLMAHGRSSAIGWIEGSLCVYKVVVKSTNPIDPNKKIHYQLSRSSDSMFQEYSQEKASQTYFAIHGTEGIKLALITTPDYFSSGIDALTGLYETVLDKVVIPVKALVRVFAATSSFNEWITVPLVVLEQ